MSELVLVKQRLNAEWQAKNKLFSAERVVGITSPQSPTLNEYGFKPTGKETEEQLTDFDDYAAGKLAEFYEKCRVAAPEDRPFYNCHLLAWYITGKVTRLEKYDSFDGVTVPHGVDSLAAAGTYAVQTPNGALPHSVVGIDGSDRNISILGDNSPLAVASNADILYAYDGVTMVRTHPRGAYHTQAYAEAC